MVPFRIRVCAGIAVCLLLMLALPAAGADEPPRPPWRVAQGLNLPPWLHLSGTHRTRYETLNNQFRAARNGSDQMLAQRTIVLTELRFAPVRIGVEVIDSRAMLDDAGTPINTTMVNPLELLQGYVGINTSDWFGDGNRSELRLGRLTLDVGSRRLVARSIYRNTINTFTGAEWRWQDSAGNRIQLFYTLPVNRKPNRATALINNDIEFDEEDAGVRFWGAYYAFASLPMGHSGEIYLLGLDEKDAGRRRTRNREFYIPGLRVYRRKRAGAVDYLFETAFQIGESRATAAASDLRDLDHFAHFQHVEIGYTWKHRWRTRLNLDFDHASGDQRAGDGNNGRFDTLFGARRFEFGPTGIYGAFARSNLLTPGLRLNTKPRPDVALMLVYRGFWLAQRGDAWTTAGVRDAGGRSGRFIGQQLEARLRLDVVPGNYRFEAGFAALFKGGFLRRAPNRNGEGDPFYAYTQIVLTF